MKASKTSVKYYVTISSSVAAYVYSCEYFGIGFILKCPFYFFTGYLCPGCGSQRAIAALLHGNLTDAIHSNILLVILIAVLVLRVVMQIIGERFYIMPTIYETKTTVNLKIITIMLIGFGVIRNIPFPLFSCFVPF